jgi:imidazolonepropionase-like amidohydrolase
VVIRAGEIVAVGSALLPPAGARTHDCTGLTIFAGLIDAHVPIDVPEPALGVHRHWNKSVRPEVRASEAPGLERKTREQLRELGFTAAALAPRAGIFAGTGALVLLEDEEPTTNQLARQALVRASVFHSVDLAPASDGAPNSAMGTIALIRQTLLDADHRAHSAGGAATPPNPSLDALVHGRNVPLLLRARDELEVLRAQKVGREFARPILVLASGTEFRRLAAIAGSGVPLLLPLDFPQAPAVETLADQERVSLRELMTWEQAPANARRLDAAGVRVALTTDRLQDRTQFPARVREAIAAGLPPARALAMLTTIPAALLGTSRLGTVEPGKLANLVVVRGTAPAHPFAKDAEIVGTWVRGKYWPTAAAPAPLRGAWTLTANIAERTVTATLELTKTGAKMRAGDKTHEARAFQRRGARVSFLLGADTLGGDKGVFVFSGVVDGDVIAGDGVDAGGAGFVWRAERDSAHKPDDKNKDKDGADAEVAIPDVTSLPFGAYGVNAMAVPGACVVEHATIWTATTQGVITDGTLIARDGKIEYVGPSAQAPSVADARVIDGRGLHVSPGLIDCHSHTGVSGSVNESGQAVTAEVRIADVLNPDDINFYRQLAGGLTAANVLHGSANPIGGQNAVVKLRWGCAHPDDMLLAGAPSGIKFALGENPKRSRAREEVTRYPRTRLGVEALLRDRFTTAREYQRAHDRYRGLTADEQARTAAPARDLELDALAEVLAGTRLVHCHSYRQDEILMLCRVARDFGFKIGTFQHVLEGYKVADAIKEVALGASSFSDWWAYKFEVYDAVPWNGEILHRAGVNVSFNSDSSELARRMNTEAAKAMQYGDLDAHTALLFVTLNPAVQLGVQARIGSLEVGKDADFALWNGPPLRTTTRCEATFVDGVARFTRTADAQARQTIAGERARLIQKVLAQAQRGRERQGARAPESDEADGVAYGCGECGCAEGQR